MKPVDGQAPEALTTVLFLVFVFIADVQDNLTPREVQRLNELLADKDWLDDALVRAALVGLGTHYISLWKAYSEGSITRDRRRLAAELARALDGLDADGAASARAALRNFAHRIASSGSPVLARFGLSAAARARLAALTDFERLLTETPEVIEHPAAVAETAAANQADAIETSPPTRAPSRWPVAELEFTKENCWKPGRTRVRCVRVTPETHDVKTFTFVTDPPRIFTYMPGQFVTLDVRIDGKGVRRSYTISSSPSRPYAITITVKRANSSTVSKWLHENVTPGFEMEITGPSGSFSCLYGPAEKLLFIAAGSGITPLMSMLRWLSDTASPVDVVFINNVRTPSDIIFERELPLIGCKLSDKSKLGIVPVQVKTGQVWNGPTGHFTEEILRYYAPDFLEREVYICGPTGYMDVVKGVFDRAGFPARRFKKESFGAARVATTSAYPRPGSAPPEFITAPPVKPKAPGTPPPTARADTVFEVVFAKSGKTISCKPDDYILEIAERHGMELANSCRTGNCGTCRLTKIEGTVLMDDQTALTEEDIQSGMVVICIGRAQSRVVLDA